MTRVAQCHCGQLKANCVGDPYPVVICHCELCQRRTGSFFHVAAWFEKHKVTIEGEAKQFTRTIGDAGLSFTFNFCPECGTSLWWPAPSDSGAVAGKIGIAGGCFAEADFPAPTVSIYEKHQHAWIPTPEGVPSFKKGIQS
ncbi:MAG: aldehyde-activating protein [Pseudomonadales bacterium]|nr:aldehyde-activating protein [Pseudomonadales bacterium]